MFSKEMMDALEADGEKLRQLTGEDHGPWEFRYALCEACGSEGRIYSGNDPHPRDEGPCPVCDGTGVVESKVEPITLDDLK
jgi:hypothetical protein